MITTLWQYRERLHPLDVRKASFALRTVHKGLADYPKPLPDFRSELNGVAELLHRSEALGGLPASERDYLEDVWRHVRQRLSSVAGNEQALHGAPHFGNLVQTAVGPVWLDFETACHGPLEWDLAGFPGAKGDAFPSIRRDVLHTLQLARSFTVSVKCWAQFGRAPEVNEAAFLHLRMLHRAIH